MVSFDKNSVYLYRGENMVQRTEYLEKLKNSNSI